MNQLIQVHLEMAIKTGGSSIVRLWLSYYINKLETISIAESLQNSIHKTPNYVNCREAGRDIRMEGGRMREGMR